MTAATGAQARSDLPPTQEGPGSHEIWAQEVLPSVGGTQDPGSVTPQTLNGMTIHLKMTKNSAMSMEHIMKAHSGMGCRIVHYVPGANYVMILVCR